MRIDLGLGILVGVDNRAEVRAFLTTRRGKVTPESVGLTAYGNRRVTGLRRGEVAMLAGVSVEYYTRLERGSLRGVSDSVLDALARALQLTETEHLLQGKSPLARWRAGAFQDIEDALLL